MGLVYWVLGSLDSPIRLGKPPFTNSADFFNIVQTAFDSLPPPCFEHECCEFFKTTNCQQSDADVFQIRKVIGSDRIGFGVCLSWPLLGGGSELSTVGACRWSLGPAP